eukprot:TRINITY_DN2979_c0_g2_i1.p1 TRINITY_DN2979_c0_g2~~TRINITY_DN2979_c0_g2_i1.p1  ORF type:complete len:434 (+),score=40.93 TRINITY_DN2979_c0_g2_i1:48-1349(+)
MPFHSLRVANSTASIYNVIAGQDVQPTENDMETLFKRFDVNGDGVICLKEMEKAMKKYGFSKQDANIVIAKGGDHKFDFTEFCRLRKLDSMSNLIQKGFNSAEDSQFLDLGDGPAEMVHIAAEEFRLFRSLCCMSDRDYYHSLESVTGGVTQESGKSGSLFWLSADKRYVLKSITKQEALKLRSILPAYVNHFRSAHEQGRLCLLPRYFGALEIRRHGGIMYVVVMNNVFDVGPAPDLVYDIKGTTEDRYVEPEPGKVMKDLNFKSSFICLPGDLAEKVKDALHHDTKFLEQHRIMDYSILVGVATSRGKDVEDPDRSLLCSVSSVSSVGRVISPEGKFDATFKFGIIDILVEYTLKKIIAHWIKKPTIGCCNEIDTEAPSYYQQRFMDSIDGLLIDEATACSVEMRSWLSAKGCMLCRGTRKHDVIVMPQTE